MVFVYTFILRDPDRSKASREWGTSSGTRWLQCRRAVLYPSLRFDFLQGGVEARRVTLLFNSDLFRRILAHETALRRSAKVRDRRKTFIQVLPDSDGHREAPALIDR
jgi:hypothetical protein